MTTSSMTFSRFAGTDEGFDCRVQIRVTVSDPPLPTDGFSAYADHGCLSISNKDARAFISMLESLLDEAGIPKDS